MSTNTLDESPDINKKRMKKREKVKQMNSPGKIRKNI
jgi:hypothetical protein